MKPQPPSTPARRSRRTIIATLLVGALSACQSPPRPTAQGAEPERAAPRYYLANDSGEAPGPCSACGSITLVYVAGSGGGTIDEPYVKNLAHQLAEVYALDVKVAPAIQLPQTALDGQRRQYDGARIIDALQSTLPAPRDDGSTVIALMNEDIYLGFKPEWRWAFGGRTTFADGGGWAVISAHRMAGLHARRRMLVMLGKYIGGIACQFEESSDPQSIMYNEVLSAADLDRMNAIACRLDSNP